MKSTKLVAVMLVLGMAVSAQAAVVYDFESVSASGWPGTALGGQDNWSTVQGDANVRNDKLNGNSLYLNNWGIVTRVNDSNWGYQINGTSLQLSMLLRINSSNSLYTRFALAGDADSSGTIEGTERAFEFGLSGNAWDIRTAGGGSSVGTVAMSTSGTEIWKMVLDVDLAANSGDGSGSMSVQYISEDDGSQDGTSTDLTAVVGLQDINLGISAMDETDYTQWDAMWMVGQGYAGQDDITLAGDVVPEPATMVLLGLGSLGLLRRKK